MKARFVISVTNDLTIDQRVNRIATTLVEAGHEVLVVGRQRKASIPLLEQPYQTHRLRMFFEEGKFFYLEYAVRLFFFLLFRRFDILWSNDMDTLLPNWMAARVKGKRVIYDSHEYWTEVPELISRPGTRKVWHWLEKRLFPRADAAVTVNPSIAEIYSEIYKMDVASLRNLPWHKGELEQRNEIGKVILYQGALNKGRGIDLMIDALEYLPGYELWIIGYGPVGQELREHAARHAWRDRVVFKGLIAFEKLGPITQQAAIGMSLEEDLGASYHYASPNKVYDYIQAGVPVLVSDLPEMRRVVDDHGVGEVLLNSERTPEAMAARIRGMVEQESKWWDCHKACDKARDVLCWEKERQVLGEIIDKVWPSRPH